MFIVSKCPGGYPKRQFECKITKFSPIGKVFHLN